MTSSVILLSHNSQALEKIEEGLKVLLQDVLLQMLAVHRTPVTMEHLVRSAAKKHKLSGAFTQCQALFAGLLVLMEGFLSCDVAFSMKVRSKFWW